MTELKFSKKKFLRTKIIYTGIFFFLYIIYRLFGCPFFSHLCGQSLDFFVPVLFIALYYMLILLAKILSALFMLFAKSISPNQYMIMDFFAEILFYCTIVMIIYDESEGAFFNMRTLILIVVGLVFALSIFRKGEDLTDEDSSAYQNRLYINKILYIGVMILAIVS